MIPGINLSVVDNIIFNVIEGLDNKSAHINNIINQLNKAGGLFADTLRPVVDMHFPLFQETLELAHLISELACHQVTAYLDPYSSVLVMLV